jgi:NADH-quinone oxidoreductase subunit J
VVAQNIAFGVIAAVVVLAALRVVTTKNVVHAALYLVVVLAGIGANFFLLGAEFVGVTQVLVYIGAIVVLFLFGIMLTRARVGRDVDLTGTRWWVGLVVALALAATTCYVLIDGFGDDELPSDTVTSTGTVSDAIFSTYLIPFEVVSVLLLAALVGAIVLARRD